LADCNPTALVQLLHKIRDPILNQHYLCFSWLRLLIYCKPLWRLYECIALVSQPYPEGCSCTPRGIWLTATPQHWSNFFTRFATPFSISTTYGDKSLSPWAPKYLWQHQSVPGRGCSLTPNGEKAGTGTGRTKTSRYVLCCIYQHHIPIETPHILN
jgi:hypothetical protein